MRHHVSVYIFSLVFKLAQKAERDINFIEVRFCCARGKVMQFSRMNEKIARNARHFNSVYRRLKPKPETTISRG